jgi:hypothetical protein
MTPTNYLKAGRAIVPFEESTASAVRLAFTIAESLARRHRAQVAVCYPVVHPGRWSEVPAVVVGGVLNTVCSCYMSVIFIP